MKLNKAWHLKHVMPRNPTKDERMKWHIAHAKNCSCREIPPKLQREMDEYIAKKQT